MKRKKGFNIHKKVLAALSGKREQEDKQYFMEEFLDVLI